MVKYLEMQTAYPMGSFDRSAAVTPRSAQDDSIGKAGFTLGLNDGTGRAGMRVSSRASEATPCRGFPLGNGRAIEKPAFAGSIESREPLVVLGNNVETLAA